MAEVAAVTPSPANSCAARPLQPGGGAAATLDGMRALEHIKAAARPSSDACFKRFGLICFLPFFDEVVAPRRCRGVHDFSENALISVLEKSRSRNEIPTAVVSKNPSPVLFCLNVDVHDNAPQIVIKH
jgi:hypothetical protein